MFKKIVFLIFSLWTLLHADMDSTSNKTGMNLLQEMNKLAQYSPKNSDLFKGMLYEYGYSKEGIDANATLAIKYYKKAYAKKSPIASFKLGWLAWLQEESTKVRINKPLEFFLALKIFHLKNNLN